MALLDRARERAVPAPIYRARRAGPGAAAPASWSLRERVDPHLRSGRSVRSRRSPPIVSVVTSGALRAGAVAIAGGRAVRAGGAGRTHDGRGLGDDSHLARRGRRRRQPLDDHGCGRRWRHRCDRGRGGREGAADTTGAGAARRFQHRGRRGAGRHQHRAHDTDQPPGDGDGATGHLRVCVPFHRLRLRRGRQRDRRADVLRSNVRRSRPRRRRSMPMRAVFVVLNGTGVPSSSPDVIRNQLRPTSTTSPIVRPFTSPPAPAPVSFNIISLRSPFFLVRSTPNLRGTRKKRSLIASKEPN